MSALDRYLQLQLMNEQGGQPTAGPAPQLPPENVPRGTQGFDPLSKGSGEAIKAVRQSIGMKQPSMMGSIFNTLGHAGNALMATDTHPFVQAMGQHGFQQEQGEQQEAAKNMEIMQFLQKAEQARQERMMHESHYAEQARHNRAQESLYGQKAMKPSKEEVNDLAVEELQKKVPGAIPLSTLAPGARNLAYKGLKERASLPSKMFPVIRTLDEMVKISGDFPDLSTSFAAAIFPDKSFGGAMSTVKRAFMPHKERVALEKFEKLANTLVKQQVHGLGSQRATVFLERILQATNPHAGLTPDSIKFIRDDYKKDYDYHVGDSEAARGAISGGYDIPELEREYNEPEEVKGGTQQNGAPQQAQVIQALGAKEQQIMMQIQQLKQQAGGQ